MIILTIIGTVLKIFFKVVFWIIKTIGYVLLAIVQLTLFLCCIKRN